MDLTQKKCVPCESWTPPMEDKKAREMLKEIPGWELSQNDRNHLQITRNFVFKDFKESISFINKVADLAEEEGHHPDIYIFYNKVTLTLSTHFIKGLSDNDFILAAKINQLN